MLAALVGLNTQVIIACQIVLVAYLGGLFFLCLLPVSINILKLYFLSFLLLKSSLLSPLLFFRNIDCPPLSRILLKQQQIAPPFHTAHIADIVYGLFLPLLLPPLASNLLLVLPRLIAFSSISDSLWIFMIILVVFFLFLCFGRPLLWNITVSRLHILTNILLLVVNSFLSYDPREGVFVAVDEGGLFDLRDDGDVVSIVKLIIVHVLYYYYLQQIQIIPSIK